MLIAEAMRQWVGKSGPLRVLDLCAAPGGKSTLLASVAPVGSLIHANEVIQSRVAILSENLTKWGVPQIAVSRHDSRDFAALEGFYDVVLADAPCSGEGLFRKDPEAADEWSENNVQLCAARQRRILAEAAPLVKPGGLLLYSTCTYNHFENEDNARWLLEQFPYEILRLDLPEAWGIRQKSFGYQCYPHLVRGEGFFLAGFRKTGGEDFRPGGKSRIPARWKRVRQPDSIGNYLLPDVEYAILENARQEWRLVPSETFESTMMLTERLYHLDPGLPLGVLKGRDFLPDHALALNIWANPDLAGLDLPKEQALAYLRKEPFEADLSGRSGWMPVRYQGVGLGWVKAVPGRLNNYYPTEWRIRMRG